MYAGTQARYIVDLGEAGEKPQGTTMDYDPKYSAPIGLLPAQYLGTVQCVDAIQCLPRVVGTQGVGTGR